jgi:hypothetical protein
MLSNLQGMSMGKGAVDPARCFKLVDSTLAPNQKQKPTAALYFPSVSGPTSPPLFLPAVEPKRMAISATRAFPLRVSGFQEIMEKVRQRQMTDPFVCGIGAHYVESSGWAAEWGRLGSSSTKIKHTCNGSSTGRPKFSKLSECFTITEDDPCRRHALQAMK